MNYNIGQVFEEVYPPEAAVWCNANNAHIEVLDGKYTIVENAPAPEPTVKEQVQALENETGLTRAVRELVLADNSGASEYVRTKAQEIETLAKELRPVVVTEPEQTDTTDTTETATTEPETEVMEPEATETETIAVQE